MEIPETVWAEAKEIVEAMMDRAPFRQEIQEVVARAIISERERCCGVVFERSHDWDTACEISQAIRNPLHKQT